MDTQQSETTQSERQKEFISSLDIKEVAFSPGAADGPAACIAGGGILLFMEGLTSQNKQDVLSSTLLAQLFSDRAIGKNDHESWIDQYLRFFGGVGWKFQIAAELDTFYPEGKQFLLDEVLSETSKDFFNNEREAIFKKAIQTLKSLNKEDQKMRLFDTSSRSPKGGIFQIGIASLTGDAVSLYMIIFSFTSKVSVGNVWTETFSTKATTFQTTRLTFTLYKDQYEPFRDHVLRKLGSRVIEGVRELDI